MIGECLLVAVQLSINWRAHLINFFLC